VCRPGTAAATRHVAGPAPLLRRVMSNRRRVASTDITAPPAALAIAACTVLGRAGRTRPSCSAALTPEAPLTALGPSRSCVDAANSMSGLPLSLRRLSCCRGPTVADPRKQHCRAPSTPRHRRDVNATAEPPSRHLACTRSSSRCHSRSVVACPPAELPAGLPGRFFLPEPPSRANKEPCAAPHLAPHRHN
jgi:hypothetical protein